MQITIADTGDLKAMTKALKQHEDGKALMKQLRGELREVAKPLAAKVKIAWRTAPSHHGKAGRRGGSLRGLLAKATRVEVRTTGRQAGVRVRTDGRKMPSGMKSLPGYAEGVRRRPWRHPVYGDRETWVVQQPFPTFYKAVQPDEQAARRAAWAAIAKVLNEIARAR